MCCVCAVCVLCVFLLIRSSIRSKSHPIVEHYFVHYYAFNISFCACQITPPPPPHTTPPRSLLGNIGASIMMEKEQGVDPAQLISKIPLGMRVPGLRDKLVKIISDYTMQLQLRESCNLVLKADCFELLKKLCYQQRRAMRVVADPSELYALHSLPSSKKRGHHRGGESGQHQ